MTKKRKAQGAEEGNGGEVWDLVKVGQEQAAAARALLRVLDLPGLPDFISENVFNILSHAAAVNGVGIGSDDPEGGYSAKALANLFAVSTGCQPGLIFEPRRDFAELLSATLRHPECPVEIYNAVGECDCLTPDRWDTPEHIRVALAQNKPAPTTRGAKKGGV